MNSKWLLFAFVSLSLSFATYGLSEAEDEDTHNSTDTKQWRIFKPNGKTTVTSARKVGTTAKRSMTTRKRSPYGTTKRSGQLVLGGNNKTPTSTKGSRQQAIGSAGRTSTTSKRTDLLRNPNRLNGKFPTTTARSFPPLTLPPVNSAIRYKPQASMTTTKARGVPEKIKQRATTRRPSMTTTRYVIRATTTDYPILLRGSPSVSVLMGLPTSFFGPMQFFSPFSMYSPYITDTSNSTTESSNVTTTVDPVEPSTTETSLTTISTLNNTTSNNGTVEYEEPEEELPTPAEYDYRNEGNSTIPAVSVPVTEIALNVTSSVGPNMIRKRRKKVISTTTTTPKPGVIRIRLRRKKTTIAPVIDTTTMENIN